MTNPTLAHPLSGIVRKLAKKVTMSGVPYFVMEYTEMQRIEDERLGAVVYLYPTQYDADTGTRDGVSGFLVGVKSAKDPRNAAHVYVVTNKHLIDAQEMSEPFVRFNKKDGSPESIP